MDDLTAYEILRSRAGGRRITRWAEPTIAVMDDPPDRGIECRVIQPALDRFPMGHVAVYADGVVMQFKTLETPGTADGITAGWVTIDADGD